MQTARIFSVAIAACWLVLSLASYTLASEQKKAEGSPSRASSRWLSLLGRRGDRRRRRGSSEVREGAAAAEGAASSAGSARSGWDSSSISSGSGQSAFAIDEAPSSAGDVGEKGSASSVLTALPASLSGPQAYPALRHAVGQLQKQLDMVTKQRRYLDEEIRTQGNNLNPESVESLKQYCTSIRYATQLLQDQIQEIKGAITTTEGLGSEAVEELLSDLQMISLGVDIDQMVYRDFQDWCTKSEGLESPNSWWADQVLKDIFSVFERRTDEQDLHAFRASASAGAAGLEAAVTSAEAVADASGGDAETEGVPGDEESTLVAEDVDAGAPANPEDESTSKAEEEEEEEDDDDDVFLPDEDGETNR